MTASVRFYGTQQLLNVIGTDLERDLARRARNVETEAKQRCPVDTGRLRSSITSGVDRDGGVPYGWAGSDVEYAGFVENGTRYMQPAHYLRDSLPAANR